MEKNASFEEIYQEEEKKIDSEVEESFPSDGEESQGVPAEKPSAEDTEMQSLDKDEDFQKATQEFQKELGQTPTLGQLKAWKKTYWGKKQAERQLGELNKRIAELESKELDDEELLELAKKRGLYQEQQQETPPATDEKGELNWDNVYLNATPEQRAWLDIIDKRAEQKVSDIKKELKVYQERFGSLDNQKTTEQLQKIEGEARNFVKEKYNMDFDKDILPEIQKKIKELRKVVRADISLAEAGYNPMTLTKLVLAEKGAELAKVQVLEEEKKKKASLKNANLEIDSNANSQANDASKSFEEIYKEEERKLGLA